MISPIGIVPIALYFLWGNQNVFPVLPAPCVDAAADILNFSRIAIRTIAAASDGIVRHVPCRIELLVQSHIFRRMAVEYQRLPVASVCTARPTYCVGDIGT